MSASKFIYVTYIRTTPEKLWAALTKPEFTQLYWYGCWHDTTWKSGASWKLMTPDGRVGDSGEVVEIEMPRRLVLRWRHEIFAEMQADGYTLCTLEIESALGSVKLNVTHEIDLPESQFIAGLSAGWPTILSSLKSLLETGEALELTRSWPEGI